MQVTSSDDAYARQYRSARHSEVDAGAAYSPTQTPYSHAPPSLPSIGQSLSGYSQGEHEHYSPRHVPHPAYDSSVQPSLTQSAHRAMPVQAAATHADAGWYHRRPSSIAYSFHDRSNGFGAMVPNRDEYRESSNGYGWDSSLAGDGALNRKRRGNLPKDATAMFKRWFDENRRAPYPSEEKKAMFCRETGLTMNQVGVTE